MVPSASGGELRVAIQPCWEMERGKVGGAVLVRFRFESLWRRRGAVAGASFSTRMRFRILVLSSIRYGDSSRCMTYVRQQKFLLMFLFNALTIPIPYPRANTTAAVDPSFLC